MVRSASQLFHFFLILSLVLSSTGPLPAIANDTRNRMTDPTYVSDVPDALITRQRVRLHGQSGAEVDFFFASGASLEAVLGALRAEVGEQVVRSAPLVGFVRGESDQREIESLSGTLVSKDREVFTAAELGITGDESSARRASRNAVDRRI